MYLRLIDFKTIMGRISVSTQVYLKENIPKCFNLLKSANSIPKKNMQSDIGLCHIIFAAVRYTKTTQKHIIIMFYNVYYYIF